MPFKPTGARDDIVKNVQYFEIAKHELQERQKQRSADFLWFCFRMMCDVIPPQTFLGENLVWVWRSQFDRLLNQRALLQEACGLLKILDRTAQHDAVTDFLQRVEKALDGNL